MFSFFSSFLSSDNLSQKINFLESGFQQPSSIPTLTYLDNPSSITYSVNEILNRYTIRKNLANNPTTDTTPSAKDIVSSLKNNSYIQPSLVMRGFYLIWNIHNRSGNGNALQIQTGTGVFINGGNPFITVNDGTIKAIQLQITNAEEGQEEVFLTEFN